jgi:hypothetical protein
VRADADAAGADAGREDAVEPAGAGTGGGGARRTAALDSVESTVMAGLA